MSRFCTIFAVIMVFALQFQAYADTSVRVRNDGKIVDIQGNILAVPNPSDPRNTDYAKYYTNVESAGGSSQTSNFYIISDPASGYMRREIDGEEAKTASNSDNAPQVTENIKPVATNNGKTSLTLEYIPTMPIYDNIQGLGSVYGD